MISRVLQPQCRFLQAKRIIDSGMNFYSTVWPLASEANTLRRMVWSIQMNQAALSLTLLHLI